MLAPRRTPATAPPRPKATARAKARRTAISGHGEHRRPRRCGRQGSKDRKIRAGDLKSDKERKDKAEGQGGGGGNSSGSGRSGAPTIPDGSDDDIVARRLRKAAEAETDPELKEKLWKEYIEYKKNAGK